MRKLTRPQLERFIATYATQERILDVGSGGSSYDRHFPNRLTVDVDPARKPEIVADAHALPFPDDAFPLVLCTEVLEHTQRPQIVADELMRVLKPGGVLVLTTRFMYPIHDSPGDYFRFTKYGLRYLFSKWDIVEQRSELGTFSTIAALLQRIGFQTDLKGGKITKALVYAAARFFASLDGIVVRQYGDINHSTREEDVFSTGVYIAVRKDA